MHNYRRYVAIAIFTLLILIFPIDVRAQFNPPNPQEPGKPVFYYSLTTSSQPSNVAWTSGDGKYSPGSRIWISTSLRNNQYTFSHWSWTVDGQEHNTTERVFEYVMTDKAVNFVAHYTFTPNNPDDPSMVLKSRLYLSCKPEGIATFNYNYGERIPVGDYVTIHAYPNQGYEFKGWFVGERKISDLMTFDYCIPNTDSYIVAQFVYNPTNPNDPNDDGTLNHPTYTLGDINNDGTINAQDLTLLTNKTLFKPMPATYIEQAADMNNDGTINAQDLTILTNILLNK